MPETVADLLACLRRAGDAPFLSAGGAQLTAATFAARAERLAAGLRARGFCTGDRLAILLHRCPEEALCTLAAARAGGLAVVLNGKLKDAQVNGLLADCEPWAVVTSPERTAALRDPAAALSGLRVLAAGSLTWAVAGGEPLAAVDAAPDALPALQAHQAAAILYTSGSTGGPKGVVQDHGNLVAGAAIVGGYLELTGSDHILAVLPLSFDYGQNQLLSAAWAGCRITVADYLGAAELGRLLAEHRPTGLAGVPSLWHDLAQAIERGVIAAADCECLRYLTNSGGRLPVADIATLRRALPQVALFSMYGLTEAFRSAYLTPAEIDRYPESFGRAVEGVELMLTDPEDGAVLEGPAIGELVHAGALVARGYWRRPEATGRRFRPDPRGGRRGTVVYSGDLVRRDAAGRLYFVARRDGLLKVAGYRISPDEIAGPVREVAGVGEVAIVGQEAGARGHRLVACVTATDAAAGDLPQRIVQHCRKGLPAYMVPAEVRVLPALPRSVHGKVDLAALQAMIGRECTDAP